MHNRRERERLIESARQARISQASRWPCVVCVDVSGACPSTAVDAARIVAKTDIIAASEQRAAGTTTDTTCTHQHETAANSPMVV
mmetsp:Transcript_45540/g.113086  ORF Transcript_45540/g.113086 Transcript_45540/m.113086 type:complete len:85 (+) Transcript_45540:358-612(+)